VSNVEALEPLVVEHWQRDDGLWTWHAKAPENGDVMATDGNQGYEHEQDCINAAKRVTHLNSTLIKI